MRFRLFYLQLTLLGLAQPGCLGGQTGDTTGVFGTSSNNPNGAATGSGGSSDMLGSDDPGYLPGVGGDGDALPGAGVGGTVGVGGMANIAGAGGSFGEAGSSGAAGSGGSPTLTDGGFDENAILGVADQARCDDAAVHDGGTDDAGSGDAGTEDLGTRPGCH